MQLIYKQGYICHQSVTTCTGQPTQTLSQLSAEVRDFENWYLFGLQIRTL